MAQAFNSSQLIPDVQKIPKGPIHVFCNGLLQALDTAFRRIAQIPFNRGEAISVSDTGTADTEFSVTHHLGRVPSGFLVTRSNKAGSLYDAGTTWTETSIKLKCSAANAALTVHVF